MVLVLTTPLYTESRQFGGSPNASIWGCEGQFYNQTDAAMGPQPDCPNCPLGSTTKPRLYHRSRLERWRLPCRKQEPAVRWESATQPPLYLGGYQPSPYCGWTKSVSHHLRPGMRIPLYIPTNVMVSTMDSKVVRRDFVHPQ